MYVTHPPLFRRFSSLYLPLACGLFSLMMAAADAVEDIKVSHRTQVQDFFSFLDFKALIDPFHPQSLTLTTKYVLKILRS